MMKKTISKKVSSANAPFAIAVWYPWLLTLFTIIGFIASFILTLEKFAIIQNPAHHLSCSINPLLSCGPIITSPEASAFGFPNPLIGLFAFSILFVVGVSMIAGATVAKQVQWYWRLFIAGHIFGLGFVVWLISEALYDIKALCIYCMVAWAVTLALNWYGFLWLNSTGRIMLPKKVRAFGDFGLRNHWGVLVSSYIAIFALIIFAFRDYFETLF